jgi:hypothetical protein
MMMMMIIIIIFVGKQREPIEWEHLLTWRDIRTGTLQLTHKFESTLTVFVQQPDFLICLPHASLKIESPPPHCVRNRETLQAATTFYQPDTWYANAVRCRNIVAAQSSDTVHPRPDTGDSLRPSIPQSSYWRIGRCSLYNLIWLSQHGFVKQVLCQTISRSASHRGGPGSRPGQSVWDLWWTKWHWDTFFNEFFGFPLSVSSFHQRSILLYLHLGKNNRSVGSRSSETVSPNQQRKKVPCHYGMACPQTADGQFSL